MEFFYRPGNKINRQTAAALFIVLLLLAAISTGLTTGTSAGTQSDVLSLSVPANAYDCFVCPPQTQLNYQQFESKSLNDFAYTKRTPANSTLASLPNCKTINGPSRILACSLNFRNLPSTDITSTYFLVDIPPPFSTICF